MSKARGDVLRLFVNDLDLRFGSDCSLSLLVSSITSASPSETDPNLWIFSWSVGDWTRRIIVFFPAVELKVINIVFEKVKSELDPHKTNLLRRIAN